MAVYTRVARHDLELLLTGYDIGALEDFEGITRGVENTNYLMTTTGGKYILTLYEKRVRPADLPFFMDLMRHMRQMGIACPDPVADRNGTVLQNISQRKAAIVTFLPGISPDEPSAAECFAAGLALGELHLAGENYTAHARANALGHDSWKALFDSCEKGTLAPATLEDVSNQLERILANWPSALPEGIIHADFFPDNVFFTGGKVTGIIDFYFSCNGMLAYDLAITINAWCFSKDGSSFHKDKSAQLVAGYQSARPMDSQEISAMPVLCHGAAMRFYLSRLYDFYRPQENARVQHHEYTDYSGRLRFHNDSGREPRDYGFAP